MSKFQFKETDNFFHQLGVDIELHIASFLKLKDKRNLCLTEKQIYQTQHPNHLTIQHFIRIVDIEAEFSDETPSSEIENFATRQKQLVKNAYDYLLENVDSLPMRNSSHSKEMMDCCRDLAQLLAAQVTQITALLELLIFVGHTFVNEEVTAHLFDVITHGDTILEDLIVMKYFWDAKWPNWRSHLPKEN